MASEMEKKKAKAAAMKAGPNSIVEDPREAKLPKPVAAPASPPAPVEESRKLEPMPLKHFLALEFGSRPDQGAGFARHAKKMKPRTILEWRAAYAEFLAKPIK